MVDTRAQGFQPGLSERPGGDPGTEGVPTYLISEGNTANLGREQLDELRRNPLLAYAGQAYVSEQQLQEDFLRGVRYAEQHPHEYRQSFLEIGGGFFRGAADFVGDVARVSVFSAEVLAKFVFCGGLTEGLRGALLWCTNGGLLDAIKFLGKALKSGFIFAGKWIESGGIQKALGAAADWVTSGRMIDWITSPETWKSIGKGVLSMSGLTDLFRCAKELGEVAACLKNGDQAGARKHLLSAAMHGVFGVISVASTVAAVATLGSSLSINAGLAAAKITATQAVKESAAVLAKETSKEIVERTVKVIGEEALEQIGTQVAKLGMTGFRDSFKACLIRLVEQQIKASGTQALTEEFMKKAIQEAITKTLISSGLKDATRKAAEEKVTKFLEKQGVAKIVEEETLKLLVNLAQSDAKNIAKTLASNGVAHADLKAKVFKRALFDGKMDQEIKKIFEDVFTRDLTHDLGERGLWKGFEKGMGVEIQGIDDEAKAIARKYGIELKEGLSKESILAIQTEMREGFKEGVEAAVRKVVNEGIEEGFKKFRRKRHRHPQLNQRKAESVEQPRMAELGGMGTRQSHRIHAEVEQPSIETARRMIESSYADDAARIPTGIKDKLGHQSFLVANTSLLGILDQNDYQGALAHSGETLTSNFATMKAGLIPPSKVNATARTEVLEGLKSSAKTAKMKNLGSSMDGLANETLPTSAVGKSNK